MADVFISYSRKDAEYVRRIRSALKKSGRDSWVDWLSIPDSSKWESEIFAGIEGADNFVFIISPDSVSSTMCMREVAHAVNCGKHLVTVLFRPTPMESLPPSLSEVQWIPYHSLGFERSFDRLITAIDTDLPWTKEHTRLLGRATEWQFKGEDKSFLLRGRDLRQAEQWVAQSAQGEKRKLTPLHLRYISNSRRTEDNRVQWVRRISICAVVVFAILALVAWRQKGIAKEHQHEAEIASAERERARQEAESQRRAAESSRDEATKQKKIAVEGQVEAERQRNIALARQLAAQAESLSQDDSQLAALLSIESMRRVPLLENDRVLRRVLPFLRTGSKAGLVLSSINRVSIAKVKFSTAGASEAALDQALLLDPGIRHDYLNLEKRLTDLSPDEGFKAASNFQKHTASILAFSDDGKYAATGSRGGTIRVFAVETGASVRSLDVQSNVDSIAFDSADKYLTIASSDGKVRQVPVRDENSLAGPSGRVGSSSRGFYVAIHDGHTLEVFSNNKGRIVQELHFDGEIRKVALSPLGESIAILAGSELKVATLPNFREIWHAVLSYRDCCWVDLAISPDRRYLALSGPRGATKFLDFANGKLLFEFSRSNESALWKPPIAFSSNSHYLSIGNLDGSISLVDVRSKKEICNILEEDILSILFPGDSPKPLPFSEPGSIKLRKGLGRVFGFVFTPDNASLIVAYKVQPRIATSRVGGPAVYDEETLIRKYSTRSKDLIVEACSWLPRSLSRAEWEIYVGGEPYRETCAPIH